MELTRSLRQRWPARSWQYLLLAIILLTPSLWLLATVPPLWRDSDAYNQLTKHPALATAWGHGPLYCLVARVPLYLGYAIERCRGPVLPAMPNNLGNSGLTNTGILLLIAAQHLALCAAALTFIRATTPCFGIRLLLAVAFASVPIFYTFAHCVGSETLSMILLLLFAASALRIASSPAEPSFGALYVFAVLLYLAILTRYVNSLLVLVLPITFLVAALRGRARVHFRSACIALAIGIASLAFARNSTAQITQWKKLNYLPRPGFTFLWRLKFLTSLSETERGAVLDRVDQRVRSEDAKKLVALLRETLRDEVRAQPIAIYDSVGGTLFAPDSKVRAVTRIRRADEAMNEVARAFLSPPTPPHWRAAAADFAAARRWPCGEIVRYLFETTAYIFPRLNEMPELSRLSTFRAASAASLAEIPERHPYLQLWRNVSLNHCLAVVLSGFLILLLRGVATAVYGAILTLVGCAMIFSTCLMGAMIQRYTLPLWELSFVTIAIFIAALASRPEHSRARY
ncbi:MAG: hypothetical protein M3032_05575 [Verrucomicrobiota bacterium]|nr:hypothetical protein [Verrucomicrobiota bacterium]